MAGLVLSASGFIISILSWKNPEFGDKTVNKEDVDKVISTYKQVSSITEHKE